MPLYLLSGGAAKGLVDVLLPAFMVATGCEVRATFSAVGAMRDRLLAGEACDVTVLTAALIDALARSGHVLADTIAPLGRVYTGVAVRTGEPLPDIATAVGLRQALLAASAIHVPDTERSTAGIHFVKVLQALGIHDAVAARLRCHPNGAAAMGELVSTRAPAGIGCTQLSEIKCTPGVTLAGLLPPEFELATVYSVAVCTAALEPELARRFARLLAGPEARRERARVGFEA